MERIISGMIFFLSIFTKQDLDNNDICIYNQWSLTRRRLKVKMRSVQRVGLKH